MEYISMRPQGAAGAETAFATRADRRDKMERHHRDNGPLLGWSRAGRSPARVLLAVGLVFTTGFWPLQGGTPTYGAPSPAPSGAAILVHDRSPAQQPGPEIDVELQAQANTLRQEGNALSARGDRRGALDRHREALALYQMAGDRAGEGISLNSLGSIYETLGQNAVALEHAQQALAIAREVRNRPGEAAALNVSGWVYANLGQYERALADLEQSLAIRREVGARPGEALTLNNIGVVYENMGQHARALEHLVQALAIRRELRDRGGEGQTLSNIGRIHSSQGQYGLALEHLQEAVLLRRDAGDRAGQGITLNNLSAVYENMGQYEPALDHAQQALAIAREVGNRAGESAALRMVGAIYERLGQYSAAVEHLQQALAHDREGGNRAGEGAALSSIGWVYQRLGQYEVALERLEEALAIRREVGNRSGEAVTLNNIGLVYGSLGQNRAALERLEQALAIHRELGNRAGEGQTLSNIGRITQRLVPGGPALEYLQQALAIRREVGDRLGQGITLNNIGFAYQGQGQHAPAVEHFQQALAIAREVGDRAGEGVALGNLGLSYQALGDLSSAADMYQQSIAAREDVRSAARLEEFKTSLAAQTVGLYDRAVLLHLQLNQPAEAFTLAERARARAFLDQLGNARLDVTRGADARLLQQEQALRAEIGSLDDQLREERAKPVAQQNGEQIAALRDGLTARQTTYAQLLTQLKLTDPEAASLVSVDPLTLPEVQRLLAPDTTLLSYYVTADKILAFVVRRDAFQVVELPIRGQELGEAITRLRAFADPNDMAPILDQLTAGLLGPLASQLTTPVVTIVPHGILHYLPFAALRNGRSYFGETYILHYLPSASVLPFIQEKRKGAADRLLAIAHSQPPGLPALRFADVEAASIASLYGTQAMIGSAATKAALQRQAPAAQLIHLAAHGELNEQQPLFSRIFLAPDATTDGSLTVHDVYGLDLAQANLVVLSSCDTQLGQQSRGDDLVGLNRAFIYAGAPTVVASLWSVNDQATAVLMAAFYRHLRAGQSKAEALQTAQAETRATYPHPYYWAAFVLTGDPGTLGGAPAAPFAASALPS
jgi:CHAT domain-containing protein/tetratricopeptide (TPR) repeat protein